MIGPHLFFKPVLWVLFTYFSNKAMAICTLMSLVIILAVLIFIKLVILKKRVKKLLYAEAILICLAFIVGGWWFPGVVILILATYLVCIWDFPIATLDTE